MSEPFISGAVSMGLLVISLFFLRFWKDTRDRLFLFFAAAFLLLLLERVSRAAFDIQTEWSPAIYLIRLLAFVMIIVAIYDKNRRP